jgi:hypothetical protein
MLTAGHVLGKVVPMPELDWHAQTIPHFDYLLRAPRDAAIPAGGHCIPVRLPAPERLLWHKLYSSVARPNSPEKSRKGLLQAAVLAAVIVEQDDTDLSAALGDAPAELVGAARS